MKKLIFIIGIELLVIAGCNNNAENKKEETMQAKRDSLINTTTTATPDNSSNSLDWPGTYTGTIPCADCEGIETSITLNKDRSYSMTTKYLGKKDATASEKKGTFTWNKEGNKIALSGIENAPVWYLVGENRLIQLDMNGNAITGDNAVKYHLRKI
jgi:uncharacterized lipoprotein NlpE involved in copper resistance